MLHPVMRAKLPDLAALSTYLDRIDQARVYSNFGPLVRELEARLAERHGLPPAGVVSVANATLGLTAALAVQAPPPGSLCLMPAWTFIASPLAAMSAGLKPYFLDVKDDWSLDTEAAVEVLSRFPGAVGAVMPVAPFGQPINPSQWDLFRERTGIAVVIDAAAGYDSMIPGDVPSVVSLHATKALGAGEGGYVASRDTNLVRQVQTYCSFGFHGARDAMLPGFNAKLSEYHAAVALAAIDQWDVTRASLVERALAYAAALEKSEAVVLQTGFGTRWISNTCVVECPAGSAASIAKRLGASGIDTRAWWGGGAHIHRATRHLAHAPLPRTEHLSGATLGLPFYVDLSLDDIQSFADILLASLPA